MKRSFLSVVAALAFLLCFCGAAGAQTFTPSQLSGKLLWLEANVGVYKDAAKTQAATTTGDAVYTWADQSGQGNDATQATTANQPSYTTASLGGNPGLTFNGSKSLSLGNPSSLNLSASTGYSVFIVSRSTSANYGTTLSKTQSGNSRFWFLYGVNGNQLSRFNQVLSTALPAVSTPVLMQYGYSQTGSATATEQINVNGDYEPLTLNTSVPAWDTTDNLVIGQTGAASLGLTGQIYEILVLDHVATEPERQAITGYFGIKYGLTAPPNIVFLGNSLTFGQNASTGQGLTTGNSYPGQTMTLLNQPTWTSANLGISGQTGAQIVYRIAASGLPSFNPLSTLNVCVIWELTNDLAQSPQQTPQVAYANVVAACKAAKAKGYYVVVLTMLPRGTSSPLETSRQTANGLLRADFSPTAVNFPSSSTPMLYTNSPYADILVDIGSDPVIGVPSANLNTTNYNGDQIHLTDAGYHYPAYAVAAAINYLAAVPSTPATPAAPLDAVHLTWTAVPGATSYRVYRSGTLVGNPTAPTFFDTPGAGVTGSYTVTAVNALGETTASPAVTRTAGAILSVNVVLNGSSQPVVTWSADPLATSYRVLRSTDHVNYTVLATGLTGTTYTDTTAPPGTVYYTVISSH